MRCIKRLIGILGLLLIACCCALAQDPGWPRKHVNSGGTVITYQPQVDDWKDFTDIKWRQAFQLTPTGGKEIVGAATFEGTTNVNTETHTVIIHGMQVLNVYFPSQDPASSAQLTQLHQLGHGLGVGLPLIVLTAVFHALGFGFINKRMTSNLDNSRWLRNRSVSSILVYGRNRPLGYPSAWSSVWAVGNRFLGALPDNRTAVTMTTKTSNWRRTGS